MSSAEPTVLIIGAGVFGSSTAYHLSLTYKDPSKITVIDRALSPPDPAASTDINKIIRADYSSPFYCDLAYEALDAWAKWPELKNFYHRTGWIMLDEEGSDLSERVRKVFRERGHDPTEDIPLAQLEGRWNGILKGTQMEGFRDAYWNPEAGWCDAAAATAGMMKAAMERGVKYVVGQVVGFKLAASGGCVSGVRTADGRHLRADQIVLATGAWTSSTLHLLENTLDIADADRVEHQVSAAGVAVAHYRMSPAEIEQLEEMPVVVYGEQGEVIPPPKENCLLKYTNANTLKNTITTPSGHHISVPPDRDQRIVPAQLKREMEQKMTSRVMPMFSRNKRVEYWRMCWDSYTPTQDWLLCRHPHERLSNLFLAVGGSFHSYKFLPTVGKYMVNVLNGTGNGREKDRAWGWKSEGEREGRGAHESTRPRKELKDVEEEVGRSKL